MASTLQIAALLVLALVATVVTVYCAGRISAVKLPPFVKGILGGLAGLVLELVRIFAAMGLTGLFPETEPSDFVVWLINFRLFNIPILMGLGFFRAMAEPLATPPAAADPGKSDPPPDSTPHPNG